MKYYIYYITRINALKYGKNMKYIVDFRNFTQIKHKIQGER